MYFYGMTQPYGKQPKGVKAVYDDAKGNYKAVLAYDHMLKLEEANEFRLEYITEA